MKYSLKINNDLRRNTYKGKYIAFEGIDGSGKSTQLEVIRDYLEKKGKTVITTSEPQSSGMIQGIIRGALSSKISIPGRAFQSVYSADRAINHSEIVEPALKRGNFVLSHRSNWSTIPYGIIDLGDDYSFSKAWPIAVANGLFSAYNQFLTPDITFYLKISAGKAIERLSKMRKKKEIYEKKEKLEKIARGYEMEIKEFPNEFIVINANQSEESVTKDIIDILERET